jgi:hypothetical protein
MSKEDSMRYQKEVVVSLCVAFMIAFSGNLGLCQAPPPLVPSLSCDPAGIGAQTFIDGNGNGVTITAVTHFSAAGSTPAYCEVRGYRWPLDLFIVALPDSWGGTYWQTGNGGAAGALGSIATGVQRGYVSASGSGGHDVSQEVGMPTFQFAYPPGDPAAEGKLEDYCTGSVHLTKLLALDMIKAYYGSDVKPARSYYNSCSTGGRQGLIEAQRFPDDFDGLVIGAPVHYLSHITQRGVWERQALASDPWTATGGTILPKLPILANAVMTKCDGVDGLVDGLIDDPRKCNFNPLSDLPACAGDVDGAACFTTAQRNAIKVIYEGPFGLAFSSKYPSHAFSSEEMVPGATAATSNWAGWVVPSPYTPTAVSRGFDLGAGWVQWVGLPLSGKGGPGWDWSTYSWTGGDPQLVVANTSPMCDAIDPDLSVVKNKAKIIHYDGWPDPATGAFMTVKYYDEALSLMGPEQTKSFYKLYMIPGMGHCRGGTGCGNVDWQTYLENWVEGRGEPEAIVGSRNAAGNPSDPNNYMTARTRPLCPYPEVARYLGTGSIDDAANFACVNIISTKVRIEPETLNLKSNGVFTAFFTLPKEYKKKYRGKKDSLVMTIVCEGAPAVKGTIIKNGRGYNVKFRVQDLINIIPGDKVTFTAHAIFDQNGETFAFEGSDTLRIIGKDEKPPKPCKNKNKCD